MCLILSLESGVVMTGNQTEEAEPDKVGTNKSVSDIVFGVWCSYDSSVHETSSDRRTIPTKIPTVR